MIAIGGTEDKPKNLIKETSNMIKPAQGTLSTNALGFSLLLTEKGKDNSLVFWILDDLEVCLGVYQF